VSEILEQLRKTGEQLNRFNLANIKDFDEQGSNENLEEVSLTFRHNLS
jgi:protein tyrosine/serine phosphatase